VNAMPWRIGTAQLMRLRESGPADPSVRSAAGSLAPGEFLGIVALFWIYVALSNVLYAHTLSVGFAHVTRGQLFASWDERIMQHLLLLPVLLTCYWVSLRVEWRPLWRALPIQFGLGVGFAALASPAMLAAYALLGRGDMHEHRMPFSFTAWLDSGDLALWMASFLSFLPTYGFGLALVTGFALYQRFRDSELHVAALEREWSAARLATLRMQLSPHTLFNLLHTIRGQIAWDPRAAQSMVVQLADLLRRLLNAGERDFSPLTDELQFVRLYLELQQKRFADRLSISLPAVSELPAVWVPSLILQPLAENAVLHGLAGHDGRVEIHLEFTMTGEELTICVRNTMAPSSVTGQQGIGLRNVRERLAVQFGDQSSMSAGPAGSGEWRAEIRLPVLREVPRSRSDTA
jgi:hypothetical protein